MDPLNPAVLNVEGVRQLISSRINKTDDPGQVPLEGPSDMEMDELELKMDDSDLLSLSKEFEENNALYEGEVNIKRRQDGNFVYYLGKQNAGLGGDKGIADNLLFDSLETFLPAALSKNPEPVVYSDNTDDGIALSKDVKITLQYLADQLVLRAKLKRAVRHWAIYFIGCLKHYWDEENNEIGLKVIFPQNLVFDKDAYIDEKGDYQGKFLGERQTVQAKDLIKMFPKKESEISNGVNTKLATSCTYTEWSTPLYCFYTYKDIVLGKYKNPNWNYDHTVPTGEYEETGTEGEEGYEKKETTEVVPGRNHFNYPKIPYTFFSVFNIGKHPHDDTNLIEQNIPNQDLIVDRNLQISYNIQNANNGLAVSGDHFNKEDAKEANDAVRKGKGIFVPSGDVRTAVMRLPAPQIPDGLFHDVAKREQDLRSIFGVQGITPAGQSGEDTVRGKILNQSYDTTRIGGGIGDVIAQVADSIFNYQVQMMYVYYDEKHFASILGSASAVEYVGLQRSDLAAGEDHRKLVVSVAPDSMKPKDELTQMNLATDMWANGSLDPLTYYEMLNLPDPKKLVERLVMWKTNPQGLLGGAPNVPVDQNVQGTEEPSTAESPPSPAIQQVPISQGAALPT